MRQKLKRMNDRISGRSWCFTLNNWSEGERTKLWEYPCVYMVLGYEKGKEGTPHIQGYVEFSSCKRFQTLHNFNERIHWERRKGTSQQAADYCKKDGAWVERGLLSHQGKRNDIHFLTDMLEDKATIKEVALADPSTFVKYYKGLEKFHFLVQDDRTEPPYIEWRWGRTGTGKTRGAIEKHPHSYYIKDGTKWWDGYANEEAIIIDDFDAQCWPFRDFLRLTDRYKYNGQTKGGYDKINSSHIYITCEYHPSHFWVDNELEQIVRRITKIIEIK